MRSQAELDTVLLSSFTEKQPSQIGDELRRLVSLLDRLDIKSVLEIGSEEGGTVRLWTKLFPYLTLVCVDANTYSGVVGKRAELEKLWRSWLTSTQTMDVIWRDSHEESVVDYIKFNFRNSSQKSFDMVFVDGDHSERGVEQDYEMYKQFVRPGGIMVFCDIHPTVRDDMQCWKWWEKFKGSAISQGRNREYHPGTRPNFLEIYHDIGKQQAFGFGVVFL